MNNVRIEDIFSSKGRVKILKAIFENGELNLSKIIRLTGLNYKVVSRHIEYLKSKGIIEEFVLGRVRIYRPNWLNPKVRVIEEFIRMFEG